MENDQFNFDEIWEAFEKNNQNFLSEDDIKCYLAHLCLEKLKDSKFQVHTEGPINRTACAWKDYPFKKYEGVLNESSLKDKRKKSIRIDLVVLNKDEEIEVATELKTVLGKDYSSRNEICDGIQNDFEKLEALRLYSNREPKIKTKPRCYFCFVNKYGWGGEKMKKVKEKLEELKNKYPHIEVKSILRNSRNW